MNILQNLIFMIKGNLANRKLSTSQSQNGSLNHTIEVENKGIQNETLHMEGYFKNEVFFKEGFDEKVVQNLEEKFDKKFRHLEEIVENNSKMLKAMKNKKNI